MADITIQKNGRWEESIALSKQDKLYKDAMVTAAASGESSVAEDLLSYFVDIGNKECFAATLYCCFDLLRADVVEEMSWQHGLNDFYMPYKIQRTRSLIDKVGFVPFVYVMSPNSGRCSLPFLKKRSRNVPRRIRRRSSRRLRSLSLSQALAAD